MPRPAKHQAPSTRWTLADLVEEGYPLGDGDPVRLLLDGPELDFSDWAMADALVEMWRADGGLQWEVRKARQDRMSDDSSRDDEPWIVRYAKRAARTTG